MVIIGIYTIENRKNWRFKKCISRTMKTGIVCQKKFNNRGLFNAGNTVFGTWISYRAP